MIDNKVYDIDQEKLWLRIMKSRRRRRVLIFWLPIGTAFMCLLLTLFYCLCEKEKPIFEEVRNQNLIANSNKEILTKEKLDVIADLDLNRLRVKAKKNKFIKHKNDQNKRKRIQKESKIITSNDANKIFAHELKKNTKALNQEDESRNYIGSKLSTKPLPRKTSFDRLAIHFSEIIEIPQATLPVIDVQEEEFKSNKRFGFELFYGRGLSRYSANTLLSNEDANFPIGYSYDYGIAFKYYTNSNFFISVGVFESHPQNVIEINNYADQKGTRLRSYPYSANLTLKLGKKNLFSTNLYYSIGVIYQCNENVGQFKIFANPRFDFPSIGTESIVMHDLENYGISNEIGYEFQLLKQNLSVSLNYNAFLRQEVSGEVRRYANIDAYDIVGNYSSNGNTLSLRFKYEYRF